MTSNWETAVSEVLRTAGLMRLVTDPTDGPTGNRDTMFGQQGRGPYLTRGGRADNAALRMNDVCRRDTVDERTKSAFSIVEHDVTKISIQLVAILNNSILLHYTTKSDGQYNVDDHNVQYKWSTTTFNLNIRVLDLIIEVKQFTHMKNPSCHRRDRYRNFRLPCVDVPCRVIRRQIARCSKTPG